MPNGPASPSRYELAPLFAIRMAGVPFDVLDLVATPRALSIAREIGIAAGDAERLRPAFREAVAAEMDAAFRSLRRAALRFMPDYALFASPSVEELVAHIAPDGEWTARRKKAQRDRTLLLYVQRLAAKNESLSAYGPLGWGSVESGARGIRLEPRPGLRRRVFFERWVADGIVAAMNADAAVAPEVAPRVHPCGRLEGETFVRLDTGVRIPLDGEARALLARCDGRTPAHALGPGLERLARDGAILWGIECPAFVHDRVGALLERVARWREGEARARWEPILSSLAAIPDSFAREPAAGPRRGILARARSVLDSLGAAPSGNAATGQRSLYRGSNVLGEECAREPALVLGGDAAREVANAAAPWLDLWRDTYAFAAHRVNERLRAIHASLASAESAVPLPAFLRAAEAAGLPLTGAGIPAVAHLAFREVRAAFREGLAGRPDARVWSLSVDDCAVVRRCFEFPRFDDLTWPSADLQLAAASPADVAAGRHRWVLAELHTPTALLGVAFASPDFGALGPWIRAAAGPLCDFGFPTDLVSHTMLEVAPVEDLVTYAGPFVPPASWRSVRPADAEVIVAEDGDVRIRSGGIARGSFARSWVLGFGFHPFTFPLGAHSPRLEAGGVVVQRESWVVGAADLPRAPYASSAPELAVDVDRLRTARGIPRYVYVRPTEEAVRRVGAGGRDKDVKPIFVDLESYPFLEVLARWMAKHGELDVTEMLPAPDQLLWREEDGRRTFELRTLFVPAR